MFSGKTGGLKQWINHSKRTTTGARRFAAYERRVRAGHAVLLGNGREFFTPLRLWRFFWKPREKFKPGLCGKCGARGRTRRRLAHALAHARFSFGSFKLQGRWPLVPANLLQLTTAGDFRLRPFLSGGGRVSGSLGPASSFFSSAAEVFSSFFRLILLFQPVNLLRSFNTGSTFQDGTLYVPRLITLLAFELFFQLFLLVFPDFVRLVLVFWLFVLRRNPILGKCRRHRKP